MWKRCLGSVISLVALAACSGTVQDQFGLSNRAPDEFQVLRRAPLVVPPDYNLTPPGEAAAAAETRQTQQARAIVTGRNAALPDGASASERALLAAVQVEPLPNIRSQLLEDYDSVTQIDESRFLAILDWQRPTFPGDEALDPDQAAADLQASGTASKVVTDRLDD